MIDRPDVRRGSRDRAVRHYIEFVAGTFRSAWREGCVVSASDAVILLVADGLVAVGRVLGGLRGRCAAEKHADALAEAEESRDSWEPDELWAAAQVGPEDSGSPRIRTWTSSWERVAAPWDSEGRPPSWYVTVGGTRVIDVPEQETRLPIPPKPAVPLWTRMRTVLNEQVRADADWVAARLGYHREDQCDNYGDW